MTEFLNRRHQQLMEYVGRGLVTDTDEWHDGAMISTATVQLTQEQLEELTERLQAIINETVEKYRIQDVEGARNISIRADVFPLPEEGH
jgi:uncharacterized membrane-anchored protein YjiN (DUF445 family)